MEIPQGVWKQHLRPRAVVGYGVKIFLPSPPNYVTRSPGSICFESSSKPAVFKFSSSKKVDIDLFHGDGQIKYSFVLTPISLFSRATTNKFQKNICFKMGAVGLIDINTKECKGGSHL